MDEKSQGWLTTLFSWGKKRQTSESEKLYAAAIGVARRPVFYKDFGVQDSVDGRLKNCGDAGKEISQQLFDSMFADMDLSLREMGAGDIGVSKRVRVMAEAFMGRLEAYVAALDNDNRTALAAALQRNLLRDDKAIDPLTNGAVDYVFALATEITNLEADALLAGHLDLS
jgi:cytochrome b pre-mRNA-processing protein 3